VLGPLHPDYHHVLSIVTHARRGYRAGVSARFFHPVPRQGSICFRLRNDLDRGALGYYGNVSGGVALHIVADPPVERIGRAHGS
jgi:hypothetical protein